MVRMAEVLAAEAADIDVVLCSTATRTRQTLDALRPRLRARSSINFFDSLYEQGIEAYFAEVRVCGEPRATMVIGHNPTIEEFALQLAGDGEKASMALLREGLPTAALAILSFDSGLADITPGSGYLRRLLRPRDL